MKPILPPFLKIANLFLKILKDFIYLFLERVEKREKNINVWLPLAHPPLGTWPTTQACTLTGNRTSDPLVHRSALNPLSHTSQGKLQTFLLTFTLPHSVAPLHVSFSPSNILYNLLIY